jgi:exodeoxyribonuclease V beta subunit
MSDFTPLNLIDVALDGRNLIEASAGAGKTFTISRLYLRLLLEKELEVDSILVVTFTEAATGELKTRIRETLMEALENVSEPELCKDRNIAEILRKTEPEKNIRALKKAVINFDRAAIFTIHGFCQRVLRENSFESSVLFDAEFITDQTQLVEEVIDDFWRIKISQAHPLFRALAVSGEMNFANLHDLASALMRKPLMRLAGDSDFSETELLDLFNALEKEWVADRKRITGIFEDAKELGLNAASANACINRFGELDNLFSGLFGKKGFEALERFSAKKIKMNKGFEAPQHRFFDLCEEFCELYKGYGIKLRLEFAEYFREELRQRKQKLNLKYFDDLLLDLYVSLRSEEGNALANKVRKSYQAALIDEFQDTDPVQYYIFDHLFSTEDRSLFIIGDPKQSIYAFRAADIFSYLEAARQTRLDKRFTLDKNWRSETSLIEGINHLFESSRHPFLLENIDFLPVQAAQESKGNQAPLEDVSDLDNAPLRLWFMEGEGDKQINKEKAVKIAIESVVGEVTRLFESGVNLGEKPLKPSDIAILVLKNTDGALMRDALLARNIPAVFSGSGNVFKTSQYTELMILLEAIAEPGNVRKIHAVLAGELVGFDGEYIDKLLEDESLEQEYERHLDKFREYLDIWMLGGFTPMFRKFVHDYDVRKKLLSEPGGERALTNFNQLAELAHRAAMENKLGPLGIIDWLKKRYLDSAMNEEHELRLERDDDAVKILTVFKSKGLEYPVVFCPFMWRFGAKIGGNKFFDWHDAEGQVWGDINNSDDNNEFLPEAEKENLSNLLRQLYVALTRARNRCYLVCGWIGNDSALTSTQYLLYPDSQSHEDVYQRLAGLADGSGGNISLKRIDEMSISDKPLMLARDQAESLKPRAFTGGISRDWGLVSYSRLTAGKHVSVSAVEPGVLRDDERFFNLNESNLAEWQEEPEGIFAFPKGAVPGTCIHSIFENLDFGDLSNANRIIADSLRNYGISEEWTGVLREMAEKVLGASLKEGIKLKDIKPGARLAELQFHFPMGRITPQKLADIVSRHPGNWNNDFAEKLMSLPFMPLQGFMQGYIDLTFSVDGRFYLLDWKSNSLGVCPEDYREDKIRESMEASLYNLQYLIYTVAVHKFLRNKLGDAYDYRRDFGGVFYLYIRGVDPGNPGYGIFYDLPSPELVEDLEGLFNENGSRK